MDKTELNRLLRQVADGSVSPEDAALKLKIEPIREVGDYAKVDMHRGIRQGVPEVIYGAGKTQEQILGIAETMLKNGQKTVLVTRVSSDAAAYVRQGLPEGTRLEYNEAARTAVIGELPAPRAPERSSWPPAAPATSPWRKRRPSPPRCSATRWYACMMWASRGFTAC